MKGKVLLGLSIIFGLFMLNSGINKFTNHMPMPEMSDSALATIIAFGKSGWLMVLVGLAEILGGLLLLLPKSRSLGAIVLFPVILGIFVFHAVQEPSGMVIGVVLLLINLFLIYSYKDKYMPMIS